MSGCVSDYRFDVGGDYLDRYVCGYLGGHRGTYVGASAACIISMFQIRIHQDCVFQTRG